MTSWRRRHDVEFPAGEARGRQGPASEGPRRPLHELNRPLNPPLPISYNPIRIAGTPLGKGRVPWAKGNYAARWAELFMQMWSGRVWNGNMPPIPVVPFHDLNPTYISTLFFPDPSFKHAFYHYHCMHRRCVSGAWGLSPPPHFLPYRTVVRCLQVYLLIYCTERAVCNNVTFAQFCVESPMTVHQIGHYKLRLVCHQRKNCGRLN